MVRRRCDTSAWRPTRRWRTMPMMRQRHATAEPWSWCRTAPSGPIFFEGLGRALAHQSRNAEALQAWREAIEVSQSLGDLEGIARLYARSSSAAWWGGNLPHQLRLCEEGLEATAGAAESADRAHLLHEAARAYWFHGSPEQAESLCREALEMAERSGAVDVQADTLATLGGSLLKRPRCRGAACQVGAVG